MKIFRILWMNYFGQVFNEQDIKNLLTGIVVNGFEFKLNENILNWSDAKRKFVFGKIDYKLNGKMRMRLLKHCFYSGSLDIRHGKVKMCAGMNEEMFEKLIGMVFEKGL